MMIQTKIYASTSLGDVLTNFESSTENGSGVESFMDSIISVAIPLAVISVFILLSFAAFKLMTSQGNPDKLKEAKDQITNAIIGFLFIILSVAILMLLSNILGINISGS